MHMSSRSCVCVCVCFTICYVTTVSYTHLDVYKRQDVMNAYGFIVDLRENVLSVGQEKIKLSMAKMTGSTNHSIKQVALAKEKVNRSGQELSLIHISLWINSQLSIYIIHSIECYYINSGTLLEILVLALSLIHI